MSFRPLGLALIAALTAVLLLPVPSPVAAQEQPVDLELSVTNRHPGYLHDGTFVVSVLNNSDATVRDIRVQLEVEDLTTGRSIFLKEAPVQGVVSDGIFDYDTLEWVVPSLRAGLRATTLLQIDNAKTARGPSDIEGALVRLQGGIVGSIPPEDPAALGNNQARHYVFDVFATLAMRVLFENRASYGVDADPIADTFTVKVTNTGQSSGAWRANSVNQFQVRLRVTPSQGLLYAATPPAGTTFDAATGIWDIGTLVTGALPEGNKQLEIRVTGRDARAGPPEDQCLTVEIEHVIPDYTAPFLPVTACMAHKALIVEGFFDILTLHDCLAGGDYPCGSRPSLELTASKSIYGLNPTGRLFRGPYAVGQVHRERFRSDDFRQIRNNMVLQPEEAVLQVPDSSITRKTDSGNTVWSTVDLFDLFFAHKNLEDAGGWTNLKASVTVTAPGGGQAPGSWVLRNRPGSFTLLTATDDTTVETITYQVQQTGADRQLPIRLEFGALGTYVVLFEIEGTKSGTTYTDSGVYTFHVGPVAELGVLSTQQTPGGGVEITVLNYGPDSSQGARAVLATGQTCEFGGVFRHQELLQLAGQAVTRTCVIPEVELTAAQLAGTEPIGHIENHVDYTVCIDGGGRDVLPKPDGESACQSEGGTWHATNVYDYLDSNNDIYLSQEPPPAVDLQPARSRTVTYLTWTRLEELFGSPVSYYQVERLEDGRWESQGSVPQPEDPQEDPEYVDTDKDRGQSPRYRVRAVNEDGAAGSWVESGGPAQPGVALALDHTTIKEPDVDSPGAVTTATVTATLTGAVSSQDITVVVSAEPATGSNPAEPNDFTLGENRTLTIPAGQRESTGVVTIIALDDLDGVDERVSITAVASYARGTIRALTLTIVDDDEPGVTLSEAALALNEEGATAGYTVALDTQPTTNVVVSLTSNSSEVTVDEDELSFTPDNWGPQTVTVRAANDDDAVDDTASITHRIVDGRSAAEYRSVADASVAVTVTDNDTAGVTVEAGAPIIVDEGQGGETYTVKLDSEPVGSVRIIASSDNDDVRVSPALFDLTSRNWRQGQTVTVSAAHDQDSDPDTATITHAIDADRTSANEYDGVNVSSVSVSVADDDSPGVRVSPKTRRIAEGRSETYNVRLNTAPSADVTLSVSSDNGDVTVGPQTLTFTSTNWDRQQRVTVTAGQDADAADDMATIGHTVTTSDANYSIAVPDVTVTVDDDDTPGITLGALSSSPADEGGAATYTVVLDAQPTSNVVIDLTSSNADVTTDAVSLTFTSANWNEAQAVTVSASEDDDSIDDTATITHTVDDANSADEFDGLSETLRVSVADNDVPGITLPDGRLAVKEAGEVTYSVVLQAEPSDGVTVDISSNNRDVTVDPGRLTFTANDWHMPQTVTVRAAADSDGNDDDFTLTHRASSSAASEYRSARGALNGTVEERTINYDSDDNKLIEIKTAAQLDAVRYDQNGDHKVDNDADRAAYMRAFPQAGCEDANGVRGACDTIGYELAADIKLSGKWTPIYGFNAILEGNGNAITGLSISRANDEQPVGMFAYNSGEVRNLGLKGVNVRGDGPVGALAGQNSGTITRVHSTGSVYGHAHTGGLVGFNLGTVERSYSEAAVTGVDSQDSGGPLWSVRTAGLVGLNQGAVRNSYATGAVRGTGHVSGLVGWNNAGGVVENSYAAGSVTSVQDFPSTGGLVGWQTATVTGSYWDTEATGQSKGAGQGDPGGAKGLTTKDMKALTDDSAGWDADIWDFGTDDEYPSLR